MDIGINLLPAVGVLEKYTLELRRTVVHERVHVVLSC